MQLRGLGHIEPRLAEREPGGVEAQLQVIRRGTDADLAAELRAKMRHAARGGHGGEIAQRQPAVELLLHVGDGALHRIGIGQGRGRGRGVRRRAAAA